MSKRKGKTNAPKARDEAKPETQAADGNGVVLSVGASTQPEAGAGEHVTASKPADLDPAVADAVVAAEPHDNPGSPVSVLGEGNDGEAAQAQGDGAQDPAAQGAADLAAGSGPLDPDGNPPDHSGPPPSGDPPSDDAAGAAAAAVDLHATVDGMVWAKEFIRIIQAGDFEIPQLWDPGYMVGWFANAIETGRSAALKGVIDPDGGLVKVGQSFWQEYERITALDGPFKDYTPAEDPVELLTDIHSALLEEKEAHKETASLLAQAQDEMIGSVEETVPVLNSAAGAATLVHGTGSWLTVGPAWWVIVEAAAAFLRANPDAQPETVVIHLRRSGFKEVPDATGRAAVAWKVFALTLRELDALDKQEDQARRDVEAAAESVKAAQAFGEGLQGRGPFATSKGGPFDPTGFSPR